MSVSADVLPISSVPVSADSAYFHFSGSDKVVFSTGITDYTYRFTTDTSSSNGFCRFAFNNNSYFSYPFNFSSFDYYLAVSVWTDDGANNLISGVPVDLSVVSYTEGNTYQRILSDFNFYHLDGTNTQGFTILGKFDNISVSSLNGFSFGFSGSFNPCTFYVRSYIYQVDKNSGATFGDIVNAIQQQTNSLINNNNSNTDRLLEQPDNDKFSEDKINGQVDGIQDKMGVLSFGETVLSDFVDLWTVTGSTELTLPAFTINVANVDYQVWDDQTFNLNQLDGWFGSFMSAVRRVSTCIVWIACLNYIIKQAEEFFDNG